MAMLHGSLIPNDQVSLTNQLCQLRVFGEGAKGCLIAGNRDLEARMSCAATHEKKSSNARGCNTKNNLVLWAQMVAESIVKIGFPCSPRTMKEKGLPCCISYSGNNPIKGRLLIRIELANT